MNISERLQHVGWPLITASSAVLRHALPGSAWPDQFDIRNRGNASLLVSADGGKSRRSRDDVDLYLERCMTA